MTRFNILCDRLPDTLSVDGEVYPIMTDFRRWILLLDLFDKCKNNSEAVDIFTLARCAERIIMKGAIPHDLPIDKTARLLDEITAFALCGAGVKDEEKEGRTSTQVFDFECDCEIILSSFLVHYGIDLTEVEMHWWKFLALLRTLPSESDFMKIVRLRSCDTTKIGDDETRRRVRRAKAALRIRQAKDE